MALVPVLGACFYTFGWAAVRIVLTSVLTCLITEGIWQCISRKPQTLTDGSAVVTGLMFALTLPTSLPLWMVSMGAFFAILFVKQMFGGLGQNFMNPAMAARGFLLISFAKYMTGISENVRSSGMSLASYSDGNGANWTFFLCNPQAEWMGEASVLAVILGGGFLLFRNKAAWRITSAYLGSFLLSAALFYTVRQGGSIPGFGVFLEQLRSNGLLFVAFFMATDPVTSPITPTGKWCYGLLLGMLTALFRVFGSASESVSYVILLGNLAAPVIDHFSAPYRIKKQDRKKGGEISDDEPSCNS